MEKTFVMVKPDGVQRGIVGEIVGRLESKGLKLVGAKLILATEAQATEHYAEHVGKPFYDGLLSFIRSGPTMAMVWEGDNAVAVVRQLVGKTNPQEAAAGTIRGDLGLSIGHNVTHAADSPESALREIPIYFKENELLEYTRIDEVWLYE